jgi:hypothetical protein
MNKPAWFIMFRYFWPAILWGIIVLILTGLPGNDFPSISSFWEDLHPDKIIHMGMFGMLMLLLAAGSYYKGGKLPISKNLIYIYLAITILMGGTTELLQKWVFIGRSCDIMDFFADAIGIFLALLFYLVVFESRKQKAR